MRKILFVLFGASVLLGCEKPEGEGGTSTIEGKAYKIVVDNNGDTLNSYYAADAEVYISYGSGTVVGDDRVWTGPTGEYKFKNLTPGTYSVYTYSYCESCAGQQEAVVQEVVIPEEKSSTTAPDLVFKSLME